MVRRSGLRGEVAAQGDRFCVISPESRVPKDHPLRPIKVLVDEALAGLSPLFDELYAVEGRPSIPPERLLKAKVLQALYTIRSEALLVEALDYNLLFRWFLDLNLLDPVWDNSTFTKNQDRLLAHRVGEVFFARVVNLAREQGWASDAHFTVDGTLNRRLGQPEELPAQGGFPKTRRRVSPATRAWTSTDRRGATRRTRARRTPRRSSPARAAGKKRGCASGCTR